MSLSVFCVCTYCVSVVVSSNSLSDVTGLDGPTGRFHCSWTALEENIYIGNEVVHSVLFLWMLILI